MNLIRPSLALRLWGRRAAIVLTAYVLVMQAVFASAVAAQVAASGGTDTAAVICRGATPADSPAGGAGGTQHHDHGVECWLACSAMAGAGIVPPVPDLAVTCAVAAPADSSALTVAVVAARASRDGEARAPPIAA